MVQVEYLKETKTFSPQEVSSMVLTKVRALAKVIQKAHTLTIHR